ncbi:MAG: hypothetical protein AAF368_06925, partial [Planctomycetota bacterium]
MTEPSQKSQSPRSRHTPLGAILLEEGLISEVQLSEALEHKKGTGMKLGQALVALDYVSHGQLAAALERQGKIQCIQLTKGIINPEVARLLGPERSREYQAIAINRIADTVTVAMEDPADVYTLDEITRALDARILAVHAEPEEISACLDHIFSMKLNLPEAQKPAAKKALAPPPKTEGKKGKQLAPPPPMSDAALAQSLDDIANLAHEELEGDEELDDEFASLDVTSEDNPVIKV